MRSSILVISTVFVLGCLNWLIFAKEHVLRHGETVLCELAPRDPRSIMQGDYMVLRYKLARDASEVIPDDVFDGHLVLTRDAQNVASFVRLDNGQQLGADEVRVRFRCRAARGFSRDAVQIGVESYFFEEGRAADFDAARYGELKVSAAGECVLIGLRDEHRRPL